MTIHNRLLISFILILSILFAFGIYQNVMYANISDIQRSSQSASVIKSELISIKSSQMDYLREYNRKYITEIFNKISVIQSEINAISIDGLTNDTKQDLENATTLFQTYEDRFNYFVSEYDQYYAIKTATSDNQKELFALIQELYLIKDINRYISLDDTLMNMLIIMHEENGSNLRYRRALDNIIDIGDVLLKSSNPFEIKILGHRIKAHAILLLENDLSLKKLYNSTQIHSDLLDNTINDLNMLAERINQEQGNYFSQLLRRLRVTYAALFTVMLLGIALTMYKLSIRITRSLNHLIKITEAIGSGDYITSSMIDDGDEFSTLIKSINSMAESLKRADFSIKTYSTQLENMVEAKTLELTMAKTDLEKINLVLCEEKEKLATLAMTDSLTGLHNRGFFMDVLNQKISESTRYSRPFSLMLIDIDFFKSVNDKYGHQVGDNVLKALSDILTSSSRASDIVARYGGEEFMLIFSDTPLEGASTIAYRIKSQVEAKDFIQKDLKITISAGLIEYMGQSEDALLKQVDDLLYQAKHKGRDRIETVLDTNAIL